MTDIKIWDAPVRIFHWALAAAIFIAYFSGDEVFNLHAAAGYAAAVLIFFRLIWGFVGPYHSRFTTFMAGPAEFGRFVRGLATGQPPRYLTHNPIGAVSTVLLLGGTIAVIWTGLQGEAGEDLHEVLAKGLMALVGLHVVGVIAESVMTRENLVRAMVTGRKRPLKGGTNTPEPSPAGVTARFALAALLTVLASFGAGQTTTLFQWPPAYEDHDEGHENEGEPDEAADEDHE